MLLILNKKNGRHTLENVRILIIILNSDVEIVQSHMNWSPTIMIIEDNQTKHQS